MDSNLEVGFEIMRDTLQLQNIITFYFNEKHPYP